MVPTLVENSKLLVYLFVNFFWKHYYYDVQDGGTALLLLMISHKLHQNNGTMCPSYIIYHEKRRHFVAALFNPFYSSMNQ